MFSGAVLNEDGGERDGLFGTDSCNYGGEQSSFIFIDQVPRPLRRLSLSHRRLLETPFANIVNRNPKLHPEIRDQKCMKADSTRLPVGLHKLMLD